MILKPFFILGAYSVVRDKFSEQWNKHLFRIGWPEAL